MSTPNKDKHDISVRGPTYTRVRTYCDGKQVSVGEEVTRWIEEHLDSLAKTATPEEIEEQIRKHFTF